MKRRANLFSTGSPVTSGSTSPDITFNNLVIVRIWQGTDYRSGQVGHASLEIPYLSIYASLWPQTEARLGMPHIIKPKWHTLTEDIIAERKDPEDIFYLFSLNITDMQKQFETRKALTIGWLLQGESSLVRANTDNCTTLVYGLLKAGNINALYSSSSMRSSFTTSSADWIPNQLAIYLSHVVRAERASHPDTVMLNEKAKCEGSMSIFPKFTCSPSQETHCTTPAHAEEGKSENHVSISEKTAANPLQSTLFTPHPYIEKEKLIAKKVFLYKENIVFLAAGTVFILLLLFLLLTRATSQPIDNHSPRLT